MTSLKVEKTNVDQDLSKILTPKVRKEIDHWVKKYPKDQKQSAVMQALTIVQDHSPTQSIDGQSIAAVASYLEMDPIAVEEVATFYSMYSFKPQGKYRFCVCDNLSCKMRGSDDIISYLSKKLNVPIINPGPLTYKKIELLLDTELTHSRKAYPISPVPRHQMIKAMLDAAAQYDH